MTDGTLDKQLRRMEEALADLDVRKSVDVMSRILHPEFKEIGASGRVFTYEGILEMLADEDNFASYQIDNFQVASLNEDVALVTYTIPKRRTGDTLKLGSQRSSIWMLMDGEWRLRFHQGTRIPA